MSEIFQKISEHYQELKVLEALVWSTKPKVLVIFILFFLNNVNALGVGPGIVNFNFTPEGINSFDFEVVNSPANDQNVEIYTSLFHINDSIREEFQDILSLDKTQLSFTKDIASQKIKVMVKFPKGFSRAGIHELNVGARPVAEGGDGMNVLAGNEVRVLINVPEQYASPMFAIPKKLSILSVKAKPVKKGEKAEVEIQIKSEATEVLKRVYGRVKLIFNGEVLSSADTKTEDIFPGETKTITASFYTVDFPVTTLPLTAEVFYSNSVERANGALTIIENLEATTCKKTSSCSTYLAIIVILVVVVLFLAYLLFRKKGVGKIFGSYDFSSESTSGESKF